MQDASIDQLLDEGMAAQSSGDLAAAEGHYRAALQLAPEEPDALHLLGIVCHQTGRRDDAREFLSQAVALAPDVALFHFNFAEALRADRAFEASATHYAAAMDLDATLVAGHLPLAECLEALGKKDQAIPQLQLALQTATGIIELLRVSQCADASGALDIAVDAATRASQVAPDSVGALDLLAKLLTRACRFAPLVEIYQKLIRLAPEERYYLGLASAHAECRDYDSAEAAAKKVLESFPNAVDAHFILGHCADRKQDLITAARHYGEMLKADPKHVPSLVNLAIALRSSGRPLEALDCLLEAQKLAPEAIGVCYNLALSYQGLGRLDEAIARCQKVLALDPDHAPTANLLGISLRKSNRSSEAQEVLEKFILKNPNDCNIHTSLASLYMDRGDITKAIDSFRRSSDPIAPEKGINSNVLLCATYDDGVSPRELFDLHVAWGAQQPKAESLPPPVSSRRHDKIRVGYVSPDLRTHSVAFFICPVLMFHDKSAFEIYCYSNAEASDHVTEMFQSLGHQWRHIAGLADERVLKIIREDEIDILVELAGHTGGTRLPLFARRPAPIQVSMIGYPCTTGLPTMDYQVTDCHIHSPGSNEPLATERLVRLPHVFACYRPPDNAPPVGPLPALTAGHITFGYFNNLAKLRDPVLYAWSRIAERLATAKFVIQTGALDDPETAKLITRRCVDAGIPAERLEIRGLSSLARFHHDLNAIDIGLDPFPFNGHTTSCQMLHMGVPIVTLAGSTRSSRMGASLMTNLGMSFLVSRSPDEYAAIAVRLASDLPRVAMLRASLRDRMETSPIMNAPLYTKNLEIAYRQMYAEECRVSS